MLSQVFSKIIESKRIQRFLDLKVEIVKSTNPSRIYVENIRSFFGISNRFAKFLCNFAVHEGLFKHRIGYLCSNCNSMIKSFDEIQQAEDEFNCDKCEIEETEQFHFHKNELTTIDYYELVDRKNQ